MDVLINEVKIQSRIKEIAREIEKEYEGKQLVFLGILKGSLPFLWELAKNIKNDIRFEFIEVSSYEGTESTGKDVIIVEDIVDTGRTLTFLKQYLLERKPNSLKIAALLSKPSRRVMEIGVDYIGFQIEDKFVVGFGLDYDQKYRNLPYVGYIE